MLSFAVVAARPGHPVPPWVPQVLADRAPDDLPFAPVAHTTWSSADGRALAAAWEGPDRLGIGRRWHADPGGFTVFAGMPWHRATPWAGTRSWAAQLADLFERVPLRSAVADLDGLFTAASLAPDGTGTVTADPLGLRALYRAEGEHVVVASNRAALAARLVTPPGQRPARDRDAMAWLVLGGTIGEARTGYEAVRRVPDGRLLELAPDRPLDVHTWDERPWWPGPPVAAAERAEVVDAAGAWVRELLHVHAHVPSHRRRMDLSGGHDSRLVLALLLQEGLQHRFNYVTWGSQDLPDLVVATELAERYQLNHNGPGQRRPFQGARRTPGPCEPEAPAGRATVGLPGFVDAARHHCWVTSGGLSLWDRILGHARPAPDVSLTGDLGELLRPRHPASGGFADLDEVRGALHAGWLRLDPAGLLLRDVRLDLLERVVRQVESARGEGASVQDAMDGFYLRNRLRPWYGVLAEHDRRNPITPFARLRTIRAAFSLGPDARRDELLAFTLVRAADVDLARHPFAGAGWPAGVVAGLDDAATYPTTPVGTGWSPPRRAGPLTAIRRLRSGSRFEGTVREEQRQAAFGSDLPGLAELVDLGAGHALFDLVDRRALERALRRADTAFASRRALYDVATAAIWLDRGESEVAGLSRP